MVAFPKRSQSIGLKVRSFRRRIPFLWFFENDSSFRDADFSGWREKKLFWWKNPNGAQIQCDKSGDSNQSRRMEFESRGDASKKYLDKTWDYALLWRLQFTFLSLSWRNWLWYSNGSRWITHRYFLFAEQNWTSRHWSNIWRTIGRFERRCDTVRESKRIEQARSFANLFNISWVWWPLLPCFKECGGVASAVNVFVREKLASVAVAEMSGSFFFQGYSLIYLTEIVIMGFWPELFLGIF